MSDSTTIRRVATAASRVLRVTSCSNWAFQETIGGRMSHRAVDQGPASRSISGPCLQSLPVLLLTTGASSPPPRSCSAIRVSPAGGLRMWRGAMQVCICAMKELRETPFHSVRDACPPIAGRQSPQTWVRLNACGVQWPARAATGHLPEH